MTFHRENIWHAKNPIDNTTSRSETRTVSKQWGLKKVYEPKCRSLLVLKKQRLKYIYKPKHGRPISGIKIRILITLRSYGIPVTEYPLYNIRSKNLLVIRKSSLVDYPTSGRNDCTRGNSAKHYRWVKKTLDIVASSINYTYDVNKMKNSILKIPWFHTSASNFSQNGQDTIGDIPEHKLATTDSFYIFGGIFPTHPYPAIPTKYNTKETASKGNIYGPFNIPKGGGLGGG